MSNQELQTVSARFVESVEKQFAAELGSELSWSDYQKTLAQHMFLKVDASLKALEDKRDPAKNKVPIKWENVNKQKLALDTVHRIGLGLDALIPNHIHPVPYLNGRTKQYDVDLRVGYLGKHYCRTTLAVEQPLDIIYNLVYDSDIFKPKMKSATNEIESYEFEITKPFSRGKVVGGFGYIMYEDPKKNKLVIVTERDFLKAESAAQSKQFWGADKWREEMQFKTLVHRVADKLPLDPKKVNARSYAYVDAQENEERVQQEVDEKGNGEVIDVEGQALEDDPPPKQEPNPEQDNLQPPPPPPPEPAPSRAQRGPDF